MVILILEYNLLSFLSLRVKNNVEGISTFYVNNDHAKFRVSM